MKVMKMINMTLTGLSEMTELEYSKNSHFNMTLLYLSEITKTGMFKE